MFRSGISRILILAGINAAMFGARGPLQAEPLATLDGNAAISPSAGEGAGDSTTSRTNLGSGLASSSALREAAVGKNGDLALAMDLNSTPSGATNWTGTATPGSLGAASTAKAVSTSRLPGTTLFLTGTLSSVSPANTIVVTRGDPWKSAGGEPLSSNSTESAATALRDGTLISIKFGIPTGSLENLFPYDRNLPGGQDTGEYTQLQAPVPAALVLGVIGLGLVGWINRRGDDLSLGHRF